MAAILKAGGNCYFFTSAIQATKALELLSKATIVERDYRTDGETYREIQQDRHGLSEYRAELELKITRQRKPAKPQLCLPGE